MVRVKLLATLGEKYGDEEVEVRASSLSELISSLSKRIPEIAEAGGKPSPLYLYLINGVDARVLGDNPVLRDEDEVSIIPINHGG